MQIPLLHDTISSISSWAASLVETSPTTPEPTATMGPLSRLAVLITALSPSLVLSATPSKIPTISSITFSGSGCPSNPRWTGTFDDLAIFYNNFDAALPGDSKNLNCQVHLQGTGGSPGWQVALKETWVSGTLRLQQGTKLEWVETAFFSQDAARTGSARGEQSYSGQRVDPDFYAYTDHSSAQVWSPCFDSSGYTGIFNVNFRAILSGDGQASFDAALHQWRLDWRRC